MMDVWQQLYAMLERAGRLENFAALMREQAMIVARIACQVGQTDEARRDALAEMRFCLSKADESAMALKTAKGRANPDAAGGFQKGGAPLA